MDYFHSYDKSNSLLPKFSPKYLSPKDVLLSWLFLIYIIPIQVKAKENLIKVYSLMHLSGLWQIEQKLLR